MTNLRNPIIKIAEDFTIYPGARYKTDGDFSGEEFYEDVLKPKIEEIWNNNATTILLDFDRTYGYASSFISEVFIRIVKDFKDKKKILKKIKFKSDDEPYLIAQIKQIIHETAVG